ncbi:MAG: glycosyltransferase family 2 protein [Candidatus Omnitrophica bacterium]|nr:glycosyltransferase family 2 protein [Candidatus Omnitrophota bacterium]
MHKLDILIPVYNEKGNIKMVLESLRKDVRVPFRVFICYDNDDDDTLEALKDYNPGRLQIVPLKNSGKGAHSAILTGFRMSDAEAVIALPADDTYNAKIIDDMYGKFKEGADMVFGSRFMEGGNMNKGPAFKTFLTRTASFLLFRLAKMPVHDATNGFCLFSRRLLNEIPIESSKGFAYSIELLVKACHRGYRIDEVPAMWYERVKGKSRFRLFKWLPEYLRWFLYGFGIKRLR